MKRFFIVAIAALFAFACGESQPKVSVEDQLADFNNRLLEVTNIVDLDAIAEAKGPRFWYESLSQEEQQQVAAKCAEFAALQREMGEWRKGLTQEESELVKECVKTQNAPEDHHKINIMQQLMMFTRTARQ